METTTNDNTTKRKGGKRKLTKEERWQEFVQFLKEKKERDGRLNKAGEWLLAHGGNSEWEITDMRAVLR